MLRLFQIPTDSGNVEFSITTGEDPPQVQNGETTEGMSTGAGTDTHFE